MLTRGAHQRLCRARDQLLAVGPDELAIAEIAQQAAMSRYHFSRLFKSVFGDPPGRYRSRERLNRARLLLAGGELSVTQVCMTVGFSSLGSFSTLFDRRFGLSPSRYRRQHAGATDALTPHCMALLPQAWGASAQNSRSPGASV